MRLNFQLFRGICFVNTNKLNFGNFDKYLCGRNKVKVIICDLKIEMDNKLKRLNILLTHNPSYKLKRIEQSNLLINLAFFISWKLLEWQLVL